MENNVSPRPLIKVIDQLKDSMIERYPEHRDFIISYAKSVPEVIKMLQENGKKLDDICSYFAHFEKFNSGVISPKLQDEIRACRIQIGDQIRLGKIALPEKKLIEQQPGPRLGPQ